MYVTLNNDNVIEVASKQPINIKGKKTYRITELRERPERELVGKRLLMGHKSYLKK